MDSQTPGRHLHIVLEKWPYLICCNTNRAVLFCSPLHRLHDVADKECIDVAIIAHNSHNFFASKVLYDKTIDRMRMPCVQVASEAITGRLGSEDQGWLLGDGLRRELGHVDVDVLAVSDEVEVMKL